MTKNILCSVSTRGRNETTLPLALMAIANQTVLPNHLIIFDDNEVKVDYRTLQMYQNIFAILEHNGVTWEVIYGACKGQHFNHQIANTRNFPWVWRVDDDCIPDPNVLENLWYHVLAYPDTGACGGAIIVPTWNLPEFDRHIASNQIADIYTSPNKQWFPIYDTEEVEHLHCSFLYRAGIVNYNLQLSRVAHREETMFTYEFIKRGYTNYVVPNANTWHLKYNNGGIRAGDNGELFRHDEEIFRKYIDAGYLVYLDNGIGDHIVFSTLLDELIEKHDNITIACCYPQVFDEWQHKVKLCPLIDVQMMVDTLEYNVYKKMSDWNWQESLQQAFRRMYL